VLHDQRMWHRHWMRCGVHMFHPVNGRQGFELLKVTEEQKLNRPPIEIIKAMLKREDDLRLSPRVQALFNDPSIDTIHVGEEVQKEVITEFFGKQAKEEMEKKLYQLRAAPALYSEKSEEIKRIPHYLKYNRSEQGTLNIGDIAPNFPLATLSCQITSFYNFIQSQLKYLNLSNTLNSSLSHMSTLSNKIRPLLIAAGSYT